MPTSLPLCYVCVYNDIHQEISPSVHIAGRKAEGLPIVPVSHAFFRGEAWDSILSSALHFSVTVMKDLLQSYQHSIGP